MNGEPALGKQVCGRERRNCAVAFGVTFGAFEKVVTAFHPGHSGPRQDCKLAVSGFPLAASQCYIEMIGGGLMRVVRQFWVGGLIVGLAGPGVAQDVAPAVAAAAVEQVVPDAGITIPALTPVTLQVDTAITSKTAKRGDKFGLTMIGDIVIDGAVVVPRGTRGEGEVVHSAGVGFGGRAGELIVAARFLDVAGERLPLQSFRINKAGANNTAEAIVASNFVPLVGLVVTGSSAEIGAGQFATAKTAKAFVIPANTRDSTRGTASK